MAISGIAHFIEVCVQKSNREATKASNRVQVITGIEWALSVTLLVLSIVSMKKGLFSPHATKVCFYIAAVNSIASMLFMTIVCAHNRRPKPSSESEVIPFAVLPLEEQMALN